MTKLNMLKRHPLHLASKLSWCLTNIFLINFKRILKEILFKRMNVYKEEYETLYPSRCGSVSRNVFYSKGTLFLIVSTPYKQTWKNISSRLEFFISIMGVFDTVDYETLPRGASTFFICFRHFRWSESVLT